MVTLRCGRALLFSAALVLAAALGVSALPAAGPTEVSGGSSSSAVRATRAGVPTGGLSATSSYAFASFMDGRPVRWDPCTPIRWTSNTAAGPAGGLTVLRSAVAKVAALTGTTWQYAGEVSTVPAGAYVPRSAQPAYAPVLIGWTDAARSDLLRGQPKSVLGMTRTAWFGVRNPDGSGSAATRAATIALDRTDRLPLRGGTSWNAVVLHELGHAMGLAHVEDGRQLMATLLPRTVSDLQSGDRAGLAALGKSAGCVTVPELRRAA